MYINAYNIRTHNARAQLYLPFKTERFYTIVLIYVQ